MNNTKLAWLAGIVDGEGTIGMYPASNHPIGRITPNYVTQVTIANDNIILISEALHVMSEIVGREIDLVHDWRNNRRYVHYQIRVTNRNDVQKVLLAIEPYLISKKAQAGVMLHLLKHHTRKGRYTKAELEVIDILKKMKHDNKTIAEGNAELNKDIFKYPHNDISLKRVEHREATTQQSEMDLES